jgi:hypothetical protein
MVLDKLSGGLAVKETQYIYPPRSQDAIPLDDTQLFAEMGWVGQLKYNGARTLIKFCSDGGVELWNRHAERFRTYTAPAWLLSQLQDVRDKLGLARDKWSLLDGELIDFKHCAIRDTVAVWDILVRDGTHLIGTTYGDRYHFLRGKLDTGESWFYTNPGKPNAHEPLDFGIKAHGNVLVPRNYEANRSPWAGNDGNPHGDAWRAVWDGVVNVANAPYTVGKPGDRNYSCHPVIEGLVFKSLVGKLKMGMRQLNNSDWMVRSRIETGRHKF